MQRFQDAGYEFIGLDHFARPTEALAEAFRDRSLQRNFQGMTTGKELDLIGLGPSAISQIDCTLGSSVGPSRRRGFRRLSTAGGLPRRFACASFLESGMKPHPSTDQSGEFTPSNRDVRSSRAAPA